MQVLTRARRRWQRVDSDPTESDRGSTVAEAVIEMLAPVRERYEALRPDEAELERILAQGAEKARAIASQTLADVRRVMALGPPG